MLSWVDSRAISRLMMEMPWRVALRDEAGSKAGTEGAEDVFHGVGGVFGRGGGGGFFDDEGVVADEGVEAEAAEPLDAGAFASVAGFRLLGDFVEGRLEVGEVDAV